MEIKALSVVVPVYNEQNNIKLLAEEVIQALRGKLEFELLFVDDASADGTVQAILNLVSNHEEVLLLRHERNRGQSAAVVTGVRGARFNWVATLDGDGQNDPRDLLKLMGALKSFHSSRVLCMGQRVNRQDSWLRKYSSWVANKVRQAILRDKCPDSGCGIKLFQRQLFLSLPLFKNCHRFLPVLFNRAGACIIQVPVSHRPRVAGVSKYGVMNRVWAGLVDLVGVAWLMRRFIDIEGESDG